MSPDDPRHGTPRGYRVHREDDEQACEPCTTAWYRYNKRATYLRSTGSALRVDATGTQRRIRALMALGYGLPVLAAELGIATGNLSYKMQQPYMARRTHEAVAELFERLAMQPPPQGWVAQRTRNIAAKRGWAPPLAWDDIDHDEKPATTGRTRKSDVDEAVVLRVMAGEHLPMTAAERREVVQRLRDRGMSYTEIERHTGITKVDRHVKRPEVAA